MSPTFTETWKELLDLILVKGSAVAPRGKPTKELLQQTVVVDMLYPVLICPERKLSYRFMATEAYWILSGDNTLEGMAPFQDKVRPFSDDGESFFGAYGPRFRAQLDYVVAKLVEDEDTRQAVMTFWRQAPAPSKDIPCTVAFSFMIRDGQLNLHAFMRSSDAWLGLPYDTFNFSMAALMVCGLVNLRRRPHAGLVPGKLYLTAASSHLYEPQWADAELCVGSRERGVTYPVPPHLYSGDHCVSNLYARLQELKEPGTEHLRWWRL